MEALENVINRYAVGNNGGFNFRPNLYELLGSSGSGGGSYDSGGGFKPSYTGVVIPAGIVENGDVHDTYKIDRYDNLYGGHTTVRIKGGKSVRLIDLPDIDTQ